MGLFQMSISGAVIIIVIVLIRSLTINRLPKKTFLFLWGIALCRLLLPFNFSSPFSAYNLMGQGVQAPQVQITNALTYVQPIGQTPTGIATTGFVKSPFNIPLFIWLLGAFVLAAYFAITYFLCRREFKTSLPIENSYATNWLAQQTVKRTITIRQSSRIFAPLTYGAWKPIILMPKNTNWQDTKRIDYILAHELVHIKRFDTVTKLLLTATLCIHWFNPLVWAMYILSNRDMELSCDETVIRSFGDTTKSAYARTLISMEESKSKLTPLCNNFSKNAIEERITAIMKMKKTSVVALAAAVLLIGGVTTVFATSAKDESGNTPQAYATDTVITKQEQADIDKQHTAELTKQYLVYKEYGLTYEPKSDSLYYNGKLVRWFSDKINVDNQYVTFVKDNDGIDLRAVRNNSYKLTGIAEVIQAEYDEHTQSIKTAQSTNGAYEQGDPSADLADQSNLLSEYGSFGMSFNSSGDMLYNNELVRYFCDGVELEAGAWSTRYQYLNKKGIVDVFTKRSVIDLGNGGKDPFGNLIGLEKSTQKEFEQRDLSDFSVSSEQANADLYSIYVPFDLTVNEQTGKLYYDGKLVRCFDDQIPTANFSSKGIGYYEKDGVIDIRTNRENTTGELLGLEKLSGSEFQKRVITDPTQPISQTGTDIFDEYKVFGLSYDKSQNALFYNGERVRLFTDIRNSNGKPIDSDEFLGSTTSNLDANGTIDVYTVRDRQTDENGDKKLTGLRIATQDEFDQATKSMGQTTRIVESAK